MLGTHARRARRALIWSMYQNNCGECITRNMQIQETLTSVNDIHKIESSIKIVRNRQREGDILMPREERKIRRKRMNIY